MHDFRVAHGATELLLIRHGEAESLPPGEDVEPLHVDLPLTQRGRAQAEAMAQRLRSRGIGAIYSSDLRRARETADALARATGLAVTEDARLGEVKIAGIGPVALHDLAEIAIAHGGWSHLPGTESSQEIRGRMTAALDSIVSANGGARVAVVSHAGAINAYVAALLGLHSDFFFPAGNTSISIVRARGDRRLLVTLNDIAHLERTA
ncbi:MAG TPA: histidine phosphatase family protein [Candidatus Baltobacteraceae bacterium]|nr:histidine phosphatase family protein [Candidatus Baltobacteraceae bacterium]